MHIENESSKLFLATKDNLANLQMNENSDKPLSEVVN